MISVLVMMVVVPGMVEIGPGKVSEEVKQGLDLRGRWTGILRTDYGVAREVVIDEENQEVLVRQARSLEHFGWFGVWDEGSGRLRMVWRGELWLGIYKQEDNHITICIRLASEGRPLDFTPGDDRNVFVLHRHPTRKASRRGK